MKILLIDGYNFIFRSNVKFKNPSKEGYNIVHNFFINLRSIVEEFSPQKIFFILEGKDNFRKHIYSKYKQNRIVKNASIQNNTFNDQKNIILDLIKFLPIIRVKADHYECDDVIAFLADNLKEEETVIISNDSDFIQLLQKGYKKLKLFNPHTKSFIAPPKYHYLVWKCLAGDESDNIPGIVSHKEAEYLASTPSKLNNFLEDEENRANFELNRSLIELSIIPESSVEFFEYDLNFDSLKSNLKDLGCNKITSDSFWNKFINTFKAIS